MDKPIIGFIGQGWIGKNYADDFEERGFNVIRYSLEEPYVKNKEAIKDCRIVFIAVPTPTRPEGFDDSFVIKALENLAAGSTAVIKSTILPGTTEKLQGLFPDLYVTHSPEFLVEKTARYDAANPTRNIIGLPVQTEEYQKRAQEVLAVLPAAPFQLVCRAKEAELIKYGANAFLYLKVVYANILYDLAKGLDCDYDKVREMVAADPRIGPSHLAVADDGGRGAGGHCFIKDFEAFIGLYKSCSGEACGQAALESWRDKNVKLLRESGKNLDLLKEVYGL
jgi:nucleotide sugar dehydrogenase